MTRVHTVMITLIRGCQQSIIPSSPLTLGCVVSAAWEVTEKLAVSGWLARHTSRAVSMGAGGGGGTRVLSWPCKMTTSYEKTMTIVK